ILTGNPGGPGQHWIAARYRLIPFPLGPIVFERVLSNGRKHTVATIPARIGDNKVLLAKDPGYLDRLRLVGGPQLQKAWIEGDWSVIEGAFLRDVVRGEACGAAGAAAGPLDPVPRHGLGQRLSGVCAVVRRRAGPVAPP